MVWYECLSVFSKNNVADVIHMSIQVAAAMAAYGNGCMRTGHTTSARMRRDEIGWAAHKNVRAEAHCIALAHVVAAAAAAAAAVDISWFVNARKY